MKKNLILICTVLVLPAAFRAPRALSAGVDSDVSTHALYSEFEIRTGRPQPPPPPPGPRVGGYSDSGCLPGGAREECGEEQVEFTVPAPGTLHVLHRNATYNCCVEGIPISLRVDYSAGCVLHLVETEVLADGGCDCMCCYNVEATIVDLAPGLYTAELCWQDWETGQELCYAEDIEIPALFPRIEGHSNSGCLSGGPREECGEDQIEFSAEPGLLHVLHQNALYNCCPDDIVISVTPNGNVLRLTEEELLTNPCYCVCCYDVEATVVDIGPGTYTVEFCWFDYDTDGQRCYEEQIVIPSSG